MVYDSNNYAYFCAFNSIKEWISKWISVVFEYVSLTFKNTNKIYSNIESLYEIKNAGINIIIKN